MIKQVLDTGVAGLMFPHIETAEQAIDAIRAVRYPQPPGAPNVEPEGLRGASNAIAARYWGMTSREYERRSDVWGLQPDADMLLILIIENRLGVENVRDIARAVTATRARVILWAGGGDMSLSYGHDEARTQAGLDAASPPAASSACPSASTARATSGAATTRASGCSSTSARLTPPRAEPHRRGAQRPSGASLVAASAS